MLSDSSPNSSETLQLRDPHSGFLDRRKNSEQRAIFEEFGHKHRNPNVNLDIVGEEKGGIHVAKGEAARPEDAPIVNYFRTRFHQLHSAKIYFETKHPELILDFQDAHATELNKLTLRERLLEIADAVKKESKAHKKRFKDLSTRTRVSTLDNLYAAAVRTLGDQALNLATSIQTYINQKTTDTSDLKKIHTEGADIWRATWHRAVLTVNTVLHGRWPYWKGKIKNWIKTKHDEDGLDYMDPAQVIGLDYIGSLARGYKGPPKQGVRFMPEKFDVDANLTAPPLAAFRLPLLITIVIHQR